MVSCLEAPLQKQRVCNLRQPVADGGRASAVKSWRAGMLMQAVNLPCLFLSLDWHLGSGGFFCSCVLVCRLWSSGLLYFSVLYRQVWRFG